MTIRIDPLSEIIAKTGCHRFLLEQMPKEISKSMRRNGLSAKKKQRSNFFRHLL